MKRKTHSSAAENALERTRSQRQIASARITRTTRKLRAVGDSIRSGQVTSASNAVHFELHESPAREVFLAGTFNDWNPRSIRMLWLGNGVWVKDLTLPPGIYEYHFVIDGQWKPDPKALHDIANPFGEQNSIVAIGPVSSSRAGITKSIG